jgi:hypothetical protein
VTDDEERDELPAWSLNLTPNMNVSVKSPLVSWRPLGKWRPLGRDPLGVRRRWTRAAELAAQIRKLTPERQRAAAALPPIRCPRGRVLALVYDIPGEGPGRLVVPASGARFLGPDGRWGRAFPWFTGMHQPLKLTCRCCDTRR